MKTYAAILRGINVGGHKKILMKDLKGLFEGLGFSDVQTYIQSGNVIFKAQSSGNLLEEIQTAIVNCYGFEVPLQVVEGDFLNQVIEQNPFAK